MESFKNIKKEDLSKILFKKVKEHYKRQTETEISERSDLLANILASDHNIMKLSQIASDLERKNNALQDQIQVKETEKIEYVDWTEEIQYAEHLDGFGKEFMNKVNAHHEMLNKWFLNSDETIHNLTTLARRFEDISEDFDNIRKECDKRLQNEALEFDSINNMIKECLQQDNGLTAQISIVEQEAMIEKQKLEDVNILISKQSQLNKEISEFNDNIIPSIAKNIEETQENISVLEADIKEIDAANNDIMNKIKDLEKNIQNERTEEELLVSHKEKIKFKNDLLKTIGSILDIESNENFADLAQSMTYREEKDKVINITNDYNEIKNDINNTKILNEDRIKQCKDLKTKIEQGQLLLKNQENELDSISKNHEEKDTELKLLKEEIDKISHSIESCKSDLISLESIFDDLKTEYNELSKEIKTDESESEEKTSNASNISKLKDISLEQTKLPSENTPKRVSNWLDNLPGRFTRSSNKSVISFSSSSSEDSTRIPKTDTQKVTSFESDKLLNVDLGLEDPSVLEANLDFSFSEGNSEYWVDNSFLQLKSSK